MISKHLIFLLQKSNTRVNLINEHIMWTLLTLFLHLFDLSEALEKMKGVYEKNSQMGDPSSLEPRITETSYKIGQLKGELVKYEVIMILRTHMYTNTVWYFGF